MTRVLVHSTRWDRGYIPGNYVSDYIPTHVTKFEKSAKDDNHPLYPWKQACRKLKVLAEERKYSKIVDIFEGEFRLREKY